MDSYDQRLFNEKQEVLNIMRKYNNKFEYGDFSIEFNSHFNFNKIKKYIKDD